MESQAGFFTGGLYPSEDFGFFEEVFQNAGEAITIFDEDGAYHAFLRLTGYSVEELLDPGFAPVIALAPEEERSMVQGRLQEARQKLEHTSTFLKTVLDETQDGLLAILQDGGILMANETAKSLLSEPNLPGKNLAAFLQDEALLLCQRRIFEHGNDGLCPGHESTLRTQEGASIEVLCHHRLVTHPNVFEPCVLFAFTDIRRIKATIRYLERLLALLPIAYKLDDPETGRILDANRAFLDWFGYSLEELKTKTWMELTPKRYVKQGLDLAKQSLETGEIVWEDKAYIAKDGREIPIHHGYTHIYHPGFGKTLALCLTLPKSETAPFP